VLRLRGRATRGDGDGEAYAAGRARGEDVGVIDRQIGETAVRPHEGAGTGSLGALACGKRGISAGRVFATTRNRSRDSCGAIWATAGDRAATSACDVGIPSPDGATPLLAVLNSPPPTVLPLPNAWL